MPVTDIIFIVLILIFIGMGARSGFVHTLGRVLGAFAGFILAQSWSSWLAGMLTMVMPSSWARVVAFTLVFLIIAKVLSFILSIVGKIFSVLRFLPFLSMLDTFFGALLGLGEAVVFLGGFIYLVLTFKPVMSVYTAIQGSSVALKIDSVFHLVLGTLLK